MASTLTLVCDDADPIYADLVKLLAKHKGRKAEPTGDKPPPMLSQPVAPQPTPPPIASPEEVEVQAIWDHLGEGSQTFITEVADWCVANGRLTFTLGFIAERTRKNVASLRAHNRNINRAMKKERIDLWKTTWDGSLRQMNFTIKSQAHLDAMAQMI